MANESDYPAKYQLEDGSGFYLLETGTDYLIKELQNYFELVRVDGAVNLWPLSEASSASPAADLIGGNNGTYQGSPTMAQTGPLVGDSTTSILGDGSTTFVLATGSTAYTAENGALTREAWVKSNASPSFAWSFQGSFWQVNYNGTTLAVISSLKNTVAGQLFNQNGGTLQHTVNYAGDWAHVAMTVDVGATTARMYVNGDQSASGLSGDFPTITAFTGTPKVWDGSSQAGIGGSSTQAIAGNIALVAMYPTALTADQIARHYRCGIQYFDSGLAMAEPSQYPQLLVQ